MVLPVIRDGTCDQKVCQDSCHQSSKEVRSDQIKRQPQLPEDLGNKVPVKGEDGKLGPV